MKLKSTIINEFKAAKVTFPCLLEYGSTGMIALIPTINGPGFQLTANNYSSVGTEWPARLWTEQLDNKDFRVVTDITINFKLTQG